MQVVLRTDEYTIYKRRDGRHAVKGSSGAWINGDEKVAALRAHDLIKAPAPKAPEPEEAAAEEPAAEAAEAGGDDAGNDSGQDEASDEARS